MINKDKLKRRFSRHAKTYDQYARVQKNMGNQLIDMVKDKSAYRILEIGSGTGYVTGKLIETFPKAEITAVDIAEGMINFAKGNIKSESVTFICGDIEAMDFTGTFDLIISNATFQWLNHLPSTLKKLRTLLSEQGCLCFSSFGENTFYELHACYQQISLDQALTPGQGFISQNHLSHMMSDIFEVKKTAIDSKDYIETFDSCLSFFNSIKKIGANNSSRHGNVKDPQFLLDVMNHYDHNFKIDDKVKATYHALFVLVN